MACLFIDHTHFQIGPITQFMFSPIPENGNKCLCYSNVAITLFSDWLKPVEASAGSTSVISDNIFKN